MKRLLSREINDDNGFTGVDDGQDNGTPTVLARVSCSKPHGNKNCEAGLSGHFGKEEVDWDEEGLGTAGDDDSVHT